MSRIACIAAFAGLVFTVSAVSFAQEPEQMEGQMGQQQQMMGQGMKGGMMRGMMSGQMVAASDGGVIVMMGNKLMKYDKDLNLKKEVEIKMPKKEPTQQQ
jgi:predicted lipid-binding transport protein (Tim44 family)